MTKKLYLETFEKCAVSLCFTLQTKCENFITDLLKILERWEVNLILCVNPKKEVLKVLNQVTFKASANATSSNTT